MSYRGYKGGMGWSSKAPQHVIDIIQLRNELYHQLLKSDFNLGVGKTGDAPIDTAFAELDKLLIKFAAANTKDERQIALNLS